MTPKNIPLRVFLLAVPLVAVLAIFGPNKVPPCGNHDDLWGRGCVAGGLVGITTVVIYVFTYWGDRRHVAPFAGVIGVWAAVGGVAANTLNRWLDNSPARVVTERVLDRWTRGTAGTRHGSGPERNTLWYATVMNWNPEGGMRFVDVTEDIYERLVPNKSLLAIKLRNGAFTCEWMESVDLPK